MSFSEDPKQWVCGKAGTMKLHRVGSIVRDIGEPCLHQSPIKMSKMLNPEKWLAMFDSDGKNFGFQKALKLIILGVTFNLCWILLLLSMGNDFEKLSSGKYFQNHWLKRGVDPSIRPEVWEFLLGCYHLSSTADYRRQLRNARRERYKDLIKQCQTMHSSIGTGSLAYVVGSKVMDMRTMTKDRTLRDTKSKNRHGSDDANRLTSNAGLDNNSLDTPFACERESSSESGDLVSVRGITDSAAYDFSSFIPISSPYNCPSPIHRGDEYGSGSLAESYIDFPPLPVTDLFEKKHRFSSGRKLRYKEEYMHSFQISNNEDLVIESNGSKKNFNGEFAMDADIYEPSESKKMEYKTEIVNRLGVSDVPDPPFVNAVTSQVQHIGEDRVSEWLWTLHQIVVDVVRTDNHLEFYADTQNLARMSDILAVYAWVDPATGYCQGMSDLLSPFVVLFDDDADAFWCFEMLLRRMRDNFQMEGPTGVMKQLQSLWRILELTDKEMFSHFSHIGAESLHFAFRMLLVLFRRELSFNEALSMWEMMWAADFDESMAYNLEEICLEPLAVEVLEDLGPEIGEEITENNAGSAKGGLQSNQRNGRCSNSENNGMKSESNHHFCGLTRNFWSKNECLNTSAQFSLAKNGDDELPVFCVAAILIMNRHKMIRETNSIDDLIKIFNDRLLTIRVKRCVRSAIKLRKKYFYKLTKNKSPLDLRNN